jgi:hypothetical protein
LLWQQPVHPLVVLHTQVPLTQVVPAGQATGVPTQEPPMQTSFVVQGLPSSHVVPFGLSCSLHTLLTQAACLHWLVGVGQSATVWQQLGTGLPLVHVPF